MGKYKRSKSYREDDEDDGRNGRKSRNDRYRGERDSKLSTRGPPISKRRTSERFKIQKGKHGRQYDSSSSESEYWSSPKRRRQKSRSRTNYSTSSRKDCEAVEKKRAKGKRKAVDEDSDLEDFGAAEFVRPRNNFGNVSEIKNVTHYRSNMCTTIKEMNKLDFTDGHIMAIKRTPFWHLFNAIYVKRSDVLMKKCRKYEDDIMEIVRAFDYDSESFVIGGEMVELDDLDAGLILGIRGGAEIINLKPNAYDIPGWVKVVFEKELANPKHQFYLYKHNILKKLIELLNEGNETRSNDIARLVHCYLMASFLSPLQNGSISFHWVDLLDDLSTVCNYNWSKFVVDVLKSQIKASKSMKCGGCTTLLQFWLCEHTNLLTTKEGECFPRFLKWDMSDLHRAMSRVKLRKITEFTYNTKLPKKMSQSSHSNTSGRYLRYARSLCTTCRGPTTIRVSESVNNPGRLYYWCNNCSWSHWCVPIDIDHSQTEVFDFSTAHARLNQYTPDNAQHITVRTLFIVNILSIVVVAILALVVVMLFM